MRATSLGELKRSGAGVSPGVKEEMRRNLLRTALTYVALFVLTGMLEDEHIHKILEAPGGPQDGVDAMINDANRRGGLDNITAIVVKIEE